MKRQWTVHRQFLPCPDSEQRWERAYQYVLQWAMIPAQESATMTAPGSPQNQEVDHADSGVRTGIHPSTG
jgi:hypothetical protein